MPASKELPYTTESIQVLDDLEAVRKRPGMYIGDVHDGSGLFHLLQEVLDNSVNEHRIGHGARIEVTLAEDGLVTVNDNGRGIPVDTAADFGVPVAEVVMTRLFAGRRLNDAHATSAGPHGVGVAVVNAVSEELSVEIRREGKLWRQEYRRGIPRTPLTSVRDLDPGEPTGTRLSFRPDPEIFSGVLRLDPAKVRLRLQELACLYPSLTVTLALEAQEELFHTPEGISSLVSSWCHLRGALFPSVARFSLRGKTDDGGPLWVEVALQLVPGGPALRTGWMNGHRLLGGTPFQGATAGILLGVRRAAKALALPVKRSIKAHLSESLVLAVRIEHPTPRYGSRTRDVVVNRDILRLLRQGLGAQLHGFLLEHPEALRRLLA